jgi:hypothetical protein
VSIDEFSIDLGEYQIEKSDEDTDYRRSPNLMKEIDVFEKLSIQRKNGDTKDEKMINKN